jgi:hypothetical protein
MLESLVRNVVHVACWAVGWMLTSDQIVAGRQLLASTGQRQRV